MPRLRDLDRWVDDAGRELAERERDIPVAAETPDAPEEVEPWLRTMFPRHFDTFAPHHSEFWGWLWSIEEDVRPRPFVAIWSRGGGKSTSAEAGAVAVGVRGRRRYVLVVSGTQDQADQRVENIAALLESGEMATFYPEHAQRKLGKFGNPRGWRRNRVRTDGGFTVDAIGLDTAARGAKVENRRPDLIILDDLDAKHDSAAITSRKISTLTTTILPTGADGTAVLAIQNLIIPHGIFSRLVDGRADFLADRIVSGPHPAVVDMKTEPYPDPETGRVRHRIIAGTPTWDGQGLERCQHDITTFGLQAFREEAQHDVKERTGALWTKAMIRRVDQAPPMKRVVVGVDPSGGGDEIGIIAAGIGYDGRGYVLSDRSQAGALGPLNWGVKTVALYDEVEGDCIVAEKNYGGDMVAKNISVAAGDAQAGRSGRVPVKLVHASRGKAVRAEPVASLYADPTDPESEGSVFHVGTFPELEAEMTGWRPGDANSPNHLDALVWTLTELMLEERGPRRDHPPPLSTSVYSICP